MTKFKVGDRVRFIGGFDNCHNERIGQEALVHGFDPGTSPVVVKFGNELHTDKEDAFELILQRPTAGVPITFNADNIGKIIEGMTLALDFGPTTEEIFHQIGQWQFKPKPTTMTKITNAFKKFLSPELQAQVKAGFRDEGLNLTASGQNALLEIVAAANADAFTKAANDVIAEQEKQS